MDEVEKVLLSKAERIRLNKLKYSQSAKGKLAARRWKQKHRKEKLPLCPAMLECKRLVKNLQNKSYRDKSPEKYKYVLTKEQRKEYRKKEYEKMKSDPLQKFVHYSRVRIGDMLNKRIKNFSVKDVVLFNKQELIYHIERLFKENMNWSNYGKGGWHIDHVKPLVMFDLTDEKSVKEALSLDNLQPLWEKENCSKGSLYDGIRHTRRIK